MNRKVLRLLSTVAIAIVGIVLILAGSLKLIGVGADDMIEGLEKARLIQHVSLISVTAIVCGFALLIPQTRPAGLFLATAYWGGAIVAHLTYNDSFAMPATFLGILWLGIFLNGKWLQAKVGGATDVEHGPS